MPDFNPRKKKIALAVMAAVGASSLSQPSLAGTWGATETTSVTLEDVQGSGLLAFTNSFEAGAVGADADAGELGDPSAASAWTGTGIIVDTEGAFSYLANNPDGITLGGGGAESSAGGDFGDPSLATTSGAAGGAYAAVESTSPTATAADAEAAQSTWGGAVIASDLEAGPSSPDGLYGEVATATGFEPSETPNTQVQSVTAPLFDMDGPGALSWAGQGAYTDGQSTTGPGIDGQGGTIETWGLAGSGGVVGFFGTSQEPLIVAGFLGGGSSGTSGLMVSGEIYTSSAAATGAFHHTLASGVGADADASAAGVAGAISGVTADGCIGSGCSSGTFTVVAAGPVPTPPPPPVAPPPPPGG